jgi:hypothetical protein
LEPSYCGAFLAASFWALMITENPKYKWLCVFIGIALILNLSGTGTVSFLFGNFVYLSLCFKSNNRRKYILSFIIVGLSLVLIISEIGYFENIKSMLVNKKDSSSGIARSAATYFTWEIFLQTRGIGIGLGSVRGASFLVSMLASLGIVGVVLLYRIYSLIFRNMEYKNRWILVFILIVLIGQIIAIPDIAYPIMWMYFFMATALLPHTMLKLNMRKKTDADINISYDNIL